MLARRAIEQLMETGCNMVGEDFRFLCTSLRFAFYLPAMGPMEERGGVFQVDDAEVGTFGFHPVGDVQRRAKDPYGFFEFAPAEGLDLGQGQSVVVRSSRGMELGTVVAEAEVVDPSGLLV